LHLNIYLESEEQPTPKQHPKSLASILTLAIIITLACILKVSINWSRDVVAEVLLGSGCGAPADFGSVVCNDLVFAPPPEAGGGDMSGASAGGDGGAVAIVAVAAAALADPAAPAEPRSTGEVDDSAVGGAWGKVLALRQILARRRQPEFGGGGGGSPERVVAPSALPGEATPAGAQASRGKPTQQAFVGVSIFVGDSLTDLAALTDADVGVLVVGPSGAPSSLRRACAAFGVEVLPLKAALALVAAAPSAATGSAAPSPTKDEAANPGSVLGTGPAAVEEKPLRLYTTESWFEITEMLAALDPYPGGLYI
jgi:hypothetical protein